MSAGETERRQRQRVRRSREGCACGREIRERTNGDSKSQQRDTEGGATEERGEEQTEGKERKEKKRQRVERNQVMGNWRGAQRLEQRGGKRRGQSTCRETKHQGRGQERRYPGKLKRQQQKVETSKSKKNAGENEGRG